jgi:hypothetical protein
VLSEPVAIGDNLKAIGFQSGDLLVQIGENPPVRLGSFLAHTHGGQGFGLKEQAIAELLDQAQQVSA